MLASYRLFFKDFLEKISMSTLIFIHKIKGLILSNWDKYEIRK